MRTLDLAAISNAKRFHEPYEFVLGSGIIREEAIAEIRRDFPAITKPGYLTVDDVQLNGRFKDLIEELEGSDLTEAMSRQFGVNLHPFPRLTTIMKKSQLKYGSIHTDGTSKVMTMLVYMNDDWGSDEGGRLRVLYDGKNFEPYAVEVPPTMGTFFAFMRSDNSWHGHRPFVGERRVVQVAWVKSQADLDRKRKNNRISQFLKGVFGR